MALTKQEVASELLQRRAIRANLVEWAKFVALEKEWAIAKHHELLLEKLQAITDGTLVHSKTGLPCTRLMVLMPPGSAKSTYTSIIFPAWFIQRWERKECRVLACSYADGLIESFSRQCRNLIEENSRTLGYSLCKDSRAVQEWSTTNGATYRCGSVGGGLSGRRADALIIDDYIGSEEDANSKLIRDKQWSWYDNDAEPRLKPDAVQIIVANRRHEEDLVGRILAREEDRWEVIKIPFFATENDPLGRSVGAPLWPEWFTTDQIETIRAKPARTQAGLYGQEPAPVDGDYFKKEHMLTYTQEEYKQLMTLDPRIYGAGDWAVSTEEHANKTCFGGAALDHNGILYILPDLFWKIAGPKEVVSQFTAFLDRRKPIVTWSEKGHISKAWGPFLKEQMLNEQVYAYIQEVTPSQNKEVRATSIQGRMAMLTVRFPAFASWWPEAMRQMLFFPGGAEDDFVDFIAHIGMGLGSMGKTKKPKEATVEDLNRPAKIDFAWIKKHHQREIKPRFADR